MVPMSVACFRLPTLDVCACYDRFFSVPDESTPKRTRFPASRKPSASLSQVRRPNLFKAHFFPNLGGQGLTRQVHFSI